MYSVKLGRGYAHSWEIASFPGPRRRGVKGLGMRLYVGGGAAVLPCMGGSIAGWGGFRMVGAARGGVI